MKKIKLIMSAVLIISLTVCGASCKGEGKMDGTSSNIGKLEKNNSCGIKLKEFKTVSVTPDEVVEYYKSVDYNTEIKKPVSYVNQYIHSQPKAKAVKFEWEYADETSVKQAKLLISDNADMSSAMIHEISGNVTFAQLQNLQTNHKYYWQVEYEQKNGRKATSKISFFKTEPGRRIINIEGVENARDLGGIKTKFGTELKQGLVFRSAEFDTQNYKITYSGIADSKNLFKIKTELDLRKPEQRGESASGESILGNDVKYVNYSCAEYYDFLKCQFGNEKDIIKIFSDYGNYPIIFHCVYGADRTGTVAYLLEALCGVEKDEIIKDYELTAWRNSTYTGFRALEAAFSKIFEGDSLEDKAYDFFYHNLKLSKMEISNIKNILTNDSAVFESDSLEKPYSSSSGYIEFHINFRNSKGVKLVKNGESILEHEQLYNGVKIKISEGTENGIILFDDGGVLEFNL